MTTTLLSFDSTYGGCASFTHGIGEIMQLTDSLGNKAVCRWFNTGVTCEGCAEENETQPTEGE